MPVNIACPHCQKALQLPETLMGKKVRCPSCKEVFTAAEPEENIRPAEEFEAVQERPTRPRRPEQEDEDEEPGRHDDDDGGRGTPHRGGLVLTMGILSVVFSLCCWPLGCVLGIIGLILGGSDLSQMAARRMDRSGQGTTNTGKILSIVGLVLSILNLVLTIILYATGVVKF